MYTVAPPRAFTTCTQLELLGPFQNAETLTLVYYVGVHDIPPPTHFFFLI